MPFSQQTRNKEYSGHNVGRNLASGDRIRRLIDKELWEKRAKGLCFHCDDKWSVNHICSKKELSVLISYEEDDGDAGDGMFAEEPGEEEEKDSIISLNFVVEITNPKTMKMSGKVRKEDSVVMIDSGATINFISNQAIQKLGITCEECGKFGVILGNGDEILGQGVCRRVTIHVQGLVIVQDFISLELGNSDLILGVQWLETLGPVTINWETQTMRFKWEGRTITLVGDPSLKRSNFFF